MGSGTDPWRGGAVTAPRGSGQEGGNPHGAARRLPPRGRRGSPRAGPECDVARACFPCATRLRFELNDASVIDKDAVEAIDGVMGAVPQSGDRY